jgi:hypothetical protein
MHKYAAQDFPTVLLVNAQDSKLHALPLSFALSFYANLLSRTAL